MLKYRPLDVRPLRVRIEAAAEAEQPELDEGDELEAEVDRAIERLADDDKPDDDTPSFDIPQAVWWAGAAAAAFFIVRSVRAGLQPNTAPGATSKPCEPEVVEAEIITLRT